MPFDLTPKQKEVRSVFATAARYLLVYGGSRSGKTFFICYAILLRAIKASGSRHAIFRNDGVDAKQSIGKDTIPKVLSLAFPDLEVIWNEKDGYFRLPNGSEIWLAGLKDRERLDKVLGREFATIYINEASQVSLNAFEIVKTRLAQVVAQVDGRPLSRKIYVDLNPTTSAHWTYRLWVLLTHPDGDRPIPDPENYAHIVVNPSDNADNLPADYIDSLKAQGEKMRRRFFDGQYTADDDNAIWRRQWVKVQSAQSYTRVVVAIDPATTSEVGSDETGIIVAAIGADGRGYVLADESGKYRPEEWARRAVSLYDTYDADAFVAEVNQGGDMVESMIRAALKGRVAAVRKVTATRAKHIRAEPVAALYEQGKVFHADEFPQLCDQMCSFTSDYDRKAQGMSPDRVDALVWAFTDLFPSIVRKKAPATHHVPQAYNPMAHR